MTDLSEQERPISEGHSAFRVISRRRRILKTIAMITAPVLIVALVVLGCFLLVGPLLDTVADPFADDVYGKEQTDAEMISFFHEHEGELTLMADEYGLPDLPGFQGEAVLAEGDDLGGLGVVRVGWNDYRYLQGLDGAGGTRTLWLSTWHVTGLFHSWSKGYVYSEDALFPLVSKLDEQSSWSVKGTDNIRGTCFVPLGDGWYLFYAYVSD